jgi:hypothetical protein
MPEPVQHVGPQWMTCGQARVLEVIARGAPHAETFHHRT